MKVRILHSHTDRGIVFPPGTILDLKEISARNLIKQGRAIDVSTLWIPTIDSLNPDKAGN